MYTFWYHTVHVALYSPLSRNVIKSICSSITSEQMTNKMFERFLTAMVLFSLSFASFPLFFGRLRWCIAHFYVRYLSNVLKFSDKRYNIVFHFDCLCGVCSLVHCALTTIRGPVARLPVHSFTRAFALLHYKYQPVH